MSFTFYVVPYQVTTFPHDNPVRYLVVDGRYPCPYPGACKHQSQSDILSVARHEAMALHKNHIECGKE
jgi:hypothetical protein